MGEVAHHYRTAKEYGHLSLSVEAASLAFMAVQLGSSQLLRLANASYVTAIRQLGDALQNLGAEQAEEALQSVLLLDMYEKLVHRDPRVSQSWLSHARGGLTLFDARETSIISSSTGCQVAARLVTAVTVSCATVGDRIPQELVKLRRNIGYRIKSVKWTFLGILVHIVNLKSDVDKGKASSSDLLIRAKQVDDQIKALDRARPSTWQPQVVLPAVNNRLVLGGYYDIYPDHFITQVSNAMCTMRLILYSMIQRHIPAESRPVEGEFHKSILDSAKQICASVPQYILPGVHPTNSIPFSPVQQLHCSTLLAPLYLINQVLDDMLVKAWIRRCLGFMWESGGLKVAKEIAAVMQTTPDLDYWTIYAMTGSYALAA
ncbi:hypothetical protein EsH8_VIII_000998 [Colletotrichum jinshuiense]